jgi:hypothetical protein
MELEETSFMDGALWYKHNFFGSEFRGLPKVDF